MDNGKYKNIVSLKGVIISLDPTKSLGNTVAAIGATTVYFAKTAIGSASSRRDKGCFVV